MTGGPYRYLLFDFDGTLSETDSLHLPTWVEALLPHGIEVDEAFYRENISGRANAEIVGDLLPGLSEREGREIVETKEAGFRSRAGELEPLPGLLEFLVTVKERGVKTGLVTKPRGRTSARSCRPSGWMTISTPPSPPGRPDPGNRTRRPTARP